jgi:phosphohistidine phosphatase
MKRLTILRHAESGSAEAGLDDFDRPLNERGLHAARRVGEEFKARKLAFDLVLASTAVRARETLDGVSESYREMPVRFEDELYLATEQTLLEIVHAAPDEAQSLMLVGHNPGLGQLVADVGQDDERGLRNRVIGKFPTAAVAILELPSDRWTDAQRGSARFVDLIFPRRV